MSKKFTSSQFMSAPMHGVLDSPAREIIRKFSPKNLLFTQMWHVAFLQSKKKVQPSVKAQPSVSDRFIAYEKIEQPLAFQISTNSTDFVEAAVEKIIEKKFSMINLNSGCPARNIIKSGAGSYLMSQPKRSNKFSN